MPSEEPEKGDKGELCNSAITSNDLSFGDIPRTPCAPPFLRKLNIVPAGRIVSPEGHHGTHANTYSI